LGISKAYYNLQISNIISVGLFTTIAGLERKN